jgi:hypothetical protein
LLQCSYVSLGQKVPKGHLPMPPSQSLLWAIMVAVDTVATTGPQERGEDSLRIWREHIRNLIDTGQLLRSPTGRLSRPGYETTLMRKRRLAWIPTERN